ncbi:MAG TPA: hypothetical protein VF210_17565 [Pseudomonadales bacterium]
MKAVKILAILALVYIGIVVAFESLIGYFQPQDQGTLKITTVDDDGTPHERVLSRLVSDGRLYVAANHWPRAWYRQALANREVQVEIDGRKGAYRVVPVEGEEFDRVNSEHSLGPVVRFLTGFPPRRLVRLDPVEDVSAAAGLPEPGG